VGASLRPPSPEDEVGGREPILCDCGCHRVFPDVWERDSMMEELLLQMHANHNETIEELAGLLADWFIDNHRAFQVKA
jgi:hypothetical protein